MDNSFDQVLVALASWLLLACAVWGALLAAALVVEAASSGRLRATTWVGCPVALRRILLAGLGAALAGGGLPAHAAGTPGEAPGGPVLRDSARPSLPVPARPVGDDPPRAGPPVVTVRPGESLWRIAADRLGSGVATTAVAMLVDRLHDQNREVIGPDPDRLRPGQRLTVPPLPRPHTHHPEESPCPSR